MVAPGACQFFLCQPNKLSAVEQAGQGVPCRQGLQFGALEFQLLVGFLQRPLQQFCLNIASPQQDADKQGQGAG